MVNFVRAMFIVLVFFLASFSGCFGEETKEEVSPTLTVQEVMSATRGQYMSIEVDSNVDWTANRSAGLFFLDSFYKLNVCMRNLCNYQRKKIDIF